MVLVVMLGQAPTKVEVTLFPAAVQLNGKFTQTAGTFGTVSLRVREGVSLQVFGGGNWLFHDTKLNDTLQNVSHTESQLSTRVGWTWGVFIGAELEPFVGTLSVFDTALRFSFTLGAGLGGGGGAVHVLWANKAPLDADPRAMGTVSSGFRVAIGEHLVVRAEIRDVVYGTQLTTLNGCNATDVAAMDANVIAGRSPTLAQISGTCRGLTPLETKGARHAMNANQSDVNVNIGAYVGVGVVF